MSSQTETFSESSSTSDDTWDEVLGMAAEYAVGEVSDSGSGIDPEETFPLHEAVVDGNVAEVEELLKSGKDVNRLDTPGFSPLSAAALCAGGIDRFRDSLLEPYYPIDELKERDVYLQIVRKLIDAGADPNPSKVDVQPLQEALESNDYLIAAYLLEHGANINAKSKGSPSTTNERMPILILAPYSGDLEKINWLLRHGADVNATDEEGRTLLHDVVSFNYGKEFVEAVLAASPDIDKRDLSGATPIFCVKSITTLKLLLENGASLDIRDNSGFTVAQEYGRGVTQEWFMEGIHLLAEHGADIQGSLSKIISDCLKDNAERMKHNGELVDDESALVYHNLKQLCVEYPIDQVVMSEILFGEVTSGKEFERDSIVPSEGDFASTLNFLLEIGVDIRATNAQGETLLHVACREKCYSALCDLVNAGLDVNKPDASGATPIHLAARNVVCLIILNPVDINVPVDIDVPDLFGSTPLHWAVLSGTIGGVGRLVSMGANRNSTDMTGLKPSELPLASDSTLNILRLGPGETEYNYGDEGLEGPATILGRCPQLDPEVLTDATIASWREHVAGVEHLQEMHRFVELVINSPCMGLLLTVDDHKDIVNSVMSVLKSVAREVASEDPTLATTVVLTGSNREGTKAIAMDEIDATFTLDTFKDKFVPTEVEMKFLSGGRTKLRCNADDQALERFLVQEGQDHYLNGRAVMNAFYVLFDRILLQTMKKLRNLSLILKTKVAVGEHETKIGSCTFLWRSAHYKDLEISVDVVLAVEISGWKPACVAEYSRLHKELPTSFFVVLKPAADNLSRNVKKDWEGLLRISASNLDVSITANVPGEIRKGYILLKALLQGPFFPRVAQIPSFILKQILYHCLNRALERLDSNLWDCDRERLVATSVTDTRLDLAPLAWAKTICREINKSCAVESILFPGSSSEVLSLEIENYHTSGEMLSWLIELYLKRES